MGIFWKDWQNMCLAPLPAGIPWICHFYTQTMGGDFELRSDWKTPTSYYFYSFPCSVSMSKNQRQASGCCNQYWLTLQWDNFHEIRNLIQNIVAHKSGEVIQIQFSAHSCNCRSFRNPQPVIDPRPGIYVDTLFGTIGPGREGCATKCCTSRAKYDFAIFDERRPLGNIPSGISCDLQLQQQYHVSQFINLQAKDIL